MESLRVPNNVQSGKPEGSDYVTQSFSAPFKSTKSKDGNIFLISSYFLMASDVWNSTCSIWVLTCIGPAGTVIFFPLALRVVLARAQKPVVCFGVAIKRFWFLSCRNLLVSATRKMYWLTTEGLTWERFMTSEITSLFKNLAHSCCISKEIWVI